MKRFLTLVMTLCLLLPCLWAGAEGATLLLPENGDAVLEGVSFPGDVIISGDNARVTLSNCQVQGNVILTAGEGTMVLLFGTTVAGDCVLQSGVSEGTIETSLPKFMTDSPIRLVSDNSLGGVIALGDFDVTFNGEAFGPKDISLYYENGGLVTYEGQPFDYYVLARWWEQGEETTLVMAEKE